MIIPSGCRNLQQESVPPAEPSREHRAVHPALVSVSSILSALTFFRPEPGPILDTAARQASFSNDTASGQAKTDCHA